MKQYKFRLPSLGADMTQAKIIKWYVEPGDSIQKGQIIVHFETEKASFDAESFHSGTLKELLVKPGEQKAVGELLAIIETEEEVTDAASPAERSSHPAPSIEQESIPSKARVSRTKAARAAPATRRLAAELGVDIETIAASGKGGIVTPADVEAALRSAKQETMKGITARLMSKSKQEIPHYYLETEIVLTQVLKELEQFNESVEPSARVLPAAVLLRAVARAAAESPDLNGIWQNGEFTALPTVDLGVAIALKQGGLIAPTIPAAEKLSLTEMMLSLNQLTQRVRRGTLLSSDMKSPSLTVTSLGDLGAHKVFGVIYPPQVALVGFGRIHQRPTCENGNVVVGKVVVMTLSADHRASDGIRGSLFLEKVVKHLTI
jgi:pyruvate dehydrogenase E2 component (dihydrolipoamide acetyltransferase)